MDATAVISAIPYPTRRAVARHSRGGRDLIDSWVCVVAMGAAAALLVLAICAMTLAPIASALFVSFGDGRWQSLGFLAP